MHSREILMSEVGGERCVSRVRIQSNRRVRGAGSSCNIFSKPPAPDLQRARRGRTGGELSEESIIL